MPGFLTPVRLRPVLGGDELCRRREIQADRRPLLRSGIAAQIFTDNGLCFSLLTGSPESANFTNTFYEVLPMLLRMAEGANRTALMILLTAPAHRLFCFWS